MAKSAVGAPGTDRNSGNAGNARSDDAIVAYNSVVKLVVLALPCIAFCIAGIYGAITGMELLGEGKLTHLAAAAIAGLTAFVLLQMAFDRRPVLVIDEKGITCTRPDTGTIPWHAIAGIGISKAVMLRKVMLVAVEEEELDEKARKHASKRSGLSGILSPQIARFEGQMAGRPIISIPVAYLTISSRKLQKLLAEKISYHG